jgi:hypothetical protein
VIGHRFSRWIVLCVAAAPLACGRSDLYPGAPRGGRGGGAEGGAAERSDGGGDAADAPGAAPPPGPILLSATHDLVDRVQLSWTVSGAAPDGFALVRDGVDLAVLAAGARGYPDTAVEAGTVGAPAALTATAGTRTTGVLLDWSPARPATHGHVYQVFALVGTSRATASNQAAGARAAPGVTGYELSRDDGATWQAAAAGPPFEDRSAPLAALDARVEALPRYPRDYVRLRVLAEPTVTPVPATYRVRAATAAGPGPASAAAIGYRGAGDEISYAWQRSADDADGGYATLPDVTGAIWFDATAPVGAGRFYRAALTADGAAGVTPGARALADPLVSLSRGALRTCGLRADGTIGCWGDAFHDVGAQRSRPMRTGR